MRSARTRTRRWFRLESEPALTQREQQSARGSCSASGTRKRFGRKTGLLMLALAMILLQAGCHGALGDWLSRSSLVPGGVPPQTEPDIEFKQSEPEMTAEADDS